MTLSEFADLKFRFISSMPICLRMPPWTAPSLAASMAAILITASARKYCLASAACACCARLGTTRLTRYHMNEGHAALLSLELLEAEAAKAGRTTIRAEDIEKVRCKCVFTTHTPVPAGHDRFPMEYLTRSFSKSDGTLRLERHLVSRPREARAAGRAGLSRICNKPRAPALR